MSHEKSLGYLLFTTMLSSLACTGVVESDGTDPEIVVYDFDMAADATMSGQDFGPTDSFDMNPRPGRDQSPEFDANMSGDANMNTPDLPPTDPCQGVTCGEGASCQNGACQCGPGLVGDPTVGCLAPDPCESMTCGARAECREGSCQCPPGFIGNPDVACEPDSPGDIALRSESDVCMRWNTERATRATTRWSIEPTDDCDPGTLHPDFLDDAVRRVNIYRWLVGLGPVVLSAGANTNTQHCATTMAAANVFTHYLDESHRCYTQEAGAGARSSNIASGVNDAASSVDLYVFDRGVPSLGHRRWVFNPAMGATGFGHRGRYSCMASFDMSNRTPPPEYVAYPAPGFFPAAALGGEWTFQTSTYRFTSSSGVEMKRVSDMSVVMVSDVEVMGSNSTRPPQIAWTPASQISAGEEYEITITGVTRGGADTSVTYRTYLTQCR